MIKELCGKYVDAVASDRGVLAFFKWFVLGVVLQVLFLLLALVPLALALLVHGDAGKILAALSFTGVFVASRVYLFAIPCARAAQRKGRGGRLSWGASGILFGPLALGLAAALPPKTPPAAP